MKRKDSAFIAFSPYPAILILVVLFVFPLVGTMAQAFFVEGRLSINRLMETFSKPYNLRIIGFTFSQATISTIFSLLIGIPGAYILSRFSFPGKRVLKAICTVPFVLPPILVVLGFVIFYGNSGFLNDALMALFHLSEPPLKILYSFQAIIIAHSFYNFPVAMNLVSSSWEQLDENCEKAAKTLGASRLRILFSITLPRLLPSILSAAALIFLFCFTSFAVILVLGGGPEFTTIEVEIYNQAKRAMDLPAAASLSMMSMTVCILILVFNIFLQRKSSRQARIGAPNRSMKSLKRLGKLLVSVYLILLILFVIAPLISIIARSFLSSSTRGGDRELSLAVYSKLFRTSSFQAIRNSLVIGISAALVATVTGALITVWLSRHKNWSIELLCMLPMSISSVIIGLGYYIISRFFNRNMAFLLIVLAHVVITLPFIIRTVLPVYRSLPQNLTNAALNLGCTASKAFVKVELPLLMAALVTGFCFAFSISIGEMNATMMLSGSTIVTIPIQIYGMINSYNYQGACALGSILMLICTIVFLLSEIARKRSVYE